MKDLKVYDGAGWQSLKGPPGPSAPSADAGNTLTLGTDALLFTTAPPDSAAYVWCKHGDAPQARYNLAKTLTPNGQPLSATNRATLIVLPGVYAGSLAVDTSFVDVHGMGHQPSLPAVTLGGIKVTAADVRVSGISVGALPFDTSGSTREVIHNCVGGSGSFGSRTGATGEAHGTYINCKGGDNSFGYGTAIASVSGTFVSCVGGARCFGSNSLPGTILNSGLFTDCMAGQSSFKSIRGTCVGCTAGSNSFTTPPEVPPSMIDPVGDLGAVGVFRRCTGEANCFNGRVERVEDCLAGDFSCSVSVPQSVVTRCICGASSFTPRNGGAFSYCTGGEDSFKRPVAGTPPTPVYVSFCRLLKGTFPVDGLVVKRFCLDGDFNEVST